MFTALKLLIILIVGAVLVSSIIRVLRANVSFFAFSWSLVPKRFKRPIIFLVSYVVYATLFLISIDLLLVLVYSVISTFLSTYFYKNENKFKEFLKDKKK